MLKKKKTNVRLGKNKGEKNIVATSNQGGVTDAELKEFIQRDSTLSGQDISSLYRSLATIIEENINLGNVVICYRSVFVNPFGWTPVGYRYAHNLWLDTARTAGLFPFIFLIILTIWHIKESVALIRKLNAGLLKTLLIACNVGFLLTFLVEPVMEGFMTYVFVFFMFMGITVQLNLRSKQRLIVSK